MSHLHLNLFYKIKHGLQAYLMPEPKPQVLWKQSIFVLCFGIFQLCVTIQEILQEAPKETTLRNKLLDKFDLSATQLNQVEVLLSLLPAENNWKILAEYIGMRFLNCTSLFVFIPFLKRNFTHELLSFFLA